MPVATITPILGQFYPMDGELTAAAICWSTVLSIATLPVVAFLIV